MYADGRSEQLAAQQFRNADVKNKEKLDVCVFHASSALRPDPPFYLTLSLSLSLFLSLSFFSRFSPFDSSSCGFKGDLGTIIHQWSDSLPKAQTLLAIFQALYI